MLERCWSTLLLLLLLALGAPAMAHPGPQFTEDGGATVCQPDPDGFWGDLKHRKCRSAAAKPYCHQEISNNCPGRCSGSGQCNPDEGAKCFYCTVDSEVKVHRCFLTSRRLKCIVVPAADLEGDANKIDCGKKLQGKCEPDPADPECKDPFTDQPKPAGTPCSVSCTETQTADPGERCGKIIKDECTDTQPY